MDERPNIDAFIDSTKAACLWFVAPGRRPASDGERLALLDTIQRNGTLAQFRRAGEFKTWLSRHSSETSAAS